MAHVALHQPWYVGAVDRVAATLHRKKLERQWRALNPNKPRYARSRFARTAQDDYDLESYRGGGVWVTEDGNPVHARDLSKIFDDMEYGV